MNLLARDGASEPRPGIHPRRRAQWRNPWPCSLLTAAVTALAAFILVSMSRSFLTRQLDPKGADMSGMRPAYVHYTDFDTEHTRFATKYSLYLYREGQIDEDTRVRIHIYTIGADGDGKEKRSVYQGAVCNNVMSG